MKRMVWAGMVVGVWAAVVTPADAHGLRRSRCGGGSSCVACAGMTGGCGGAGKGYGEQALTAYPPVYKQRTVPTTINRVVSKVVEEPYKYTEMVQEVTPQKRMETYYTTQTKQVPYTYSVSVPVVTPQKRMETYYTTQTKQVPYT